MTERRSLEGAFALAPRERPQPTPDPEPPADAAPATSQPRGPRRLRSAEQPASRPLRELAATSFYVPAGSVAAPWRAHARQNGQTLAEVLVAASQAVTPERVADALRRPGWDTSGGGMPSWSVPEAEEASVNVQVRLGAVQLQWLDERVAELGASSRSALVAALLSLHLQQS